MNRERNIEAKKMENWNIRQDIFNRRRNALLNLADELSMICNAQIAIIIFSEAGNLFEFSIPSSGMEQILLRRSRILGSSDVSKEAESGEVRVLKNKIAKLEEEVIGLSSILEEKEQVIMQLSDKARLQEQCAMLENEKLRGQIVELQCLHQSREIVTLQLFPCPVKRIFKRKKSIVQDNALTQDVICCNSSVAEDDELETKIQLGYVQSFV